MLKRTEESSLTSWYFEIDRPLLWCILGLIFIGVWAMISAGSVAAERIGQPWHFFILKALPFFGIGIITLFAASALTKKWTFRLSVANVAICLLLLLITLVAPTVVKGSARWVNLPGIGSVMPSDLMKPGFIIITAWFLTKMKFLYGENIFTNKASWQAKLFSWWSYLAFFVPAFLIILQHPDFGTALLYFAVFSAMMFLAGLPLWLIPGLGAVVVGVLTFGFLFSNHIHNRLLNFFGGGGDDFQIRQSIQSIQHGGLLGSGDDAFVKQSLPDAHTDFVFSAIAEDNGAILACVLLGILLYVLKRLASDAISARDPFVFYAAGGAAALFGTQVCINLMSALHLFAPKGMTLPFISYGGSSFVAFCLLFGMIIALVREDKWR
ncbi:MAG: FtsW/RodA/SpoVE family cell cycle protein [Rickettsiales bacterium]|jgi:cell division protein FtsW|nr:FtsW/RodA/SpoVE family cell cycle protein [Rickettsiales bacterium]